MGVTFLELHDFLVNLFFYLEKTDGVLRTKIVVIRINNHTKLHGHVSQVVTLGA